MSGEDHGPWYNEQVVLGANYRPTEFRAAFGICQLDRIEDFLVRRATIAHRYDAALSELPLDRPVECPQCRSV